MPDNQQKIKSRDLERQANALLRGEGLAPVRPRALLGKVGRNEADKNLARRDLRKARLEAVNAYRRLPDAARRQLNQRFKQARAADPALDWDDWLRTNLPSSC